MGDQPGRVVDPGSRGAAELDATISAPVAEEVAQADSSVEPQRAVRDPQQVAEPRVEVAAAQVQDLQRDGQLDVAAHGEARRRRHRHGLGDVGEATRDGDNLVPAAQRDGGAGDGGGLQNLCGDLTELDLGGGAVRRHRAPSRAGVGEINLNLKIASRLSVGRLRVAGVMSPPAGDGVQMPIATESELAETLTEAVARVCRKPLEEITPTATFEELGLDSICLAEIVAEIEDLLGQSLSDPDLDRLLSTNCLAEVQAVVWPLIVAPALS